jgi:cbb3-type cytochrome oxidase subunit 3
MNEQLINELCEKFHTTVDNLIPVYSKYAMTKDITNIIIEILLIILSIAIIWFVLWWAKRRDIDWEWDTPVSLIFIIVIAGVVMAFCVIALILDIRDYVLWSISPEMRFLEQVVNTVK